MSKRKTKKRIFKCPNCGVETENFLALGFHVDREVYEALVKR